MPPKKRKLSPDQAMKAAASTEGSVVQIYGKPFAIGKVIGKGGFGSIHIAASGNKVTAKSPYVAKVEVLSHSAGQNEVLCYDNALLRDPIKSKHGAEWTKKMKFKRTGLGSLIDSMEGVAINGHFFRISIFRRHGPSIASLLGLKPGEHYIFDGQIALRMALEMMDSLEYLHSRGYAHGDLKPSNICYGIYDGDGLEGRLGKKENLFLIDYGIASPFSGKPMDIDNDHTDYVENPKNRHNGTLRYTSIDAHSGCDISRRSDLHVLGYVMLNLVGALPWLELCDGATGKDFKKGAERVEKEKRKYTPICGPDGLTSSQAKAAAKKLMKACCGTEKFAESGAIESFLTEVFALSYFDRPDYASLRKILKSKLPASTRSVAFDKLI